MDDEVDKRSARNQSADLTRVISLCAQHDLNRLHTSTMVTTLNRRASRQLTNFIVFMPIRPLTTIARAPHVLRVVFSLTRFNRGQRPLTSSLGPRVGARLAEERRTL